MRHLFMAAQFTVMNVTMTNAIVTTHTHTM